MKLELTTDETVLLRGILSDELGTIREEVVHADDHAVAAEMKRQEALVKGMLARLMPPDTKAGPQKV